MKNISIFAAAAVVAAIVTSTAVSAQQSKTPPSDKTMQGHDAMSGDMTGAMKHGEMKEGDMSGMQGMMPMMKMMEQCTEMMAAMNDHMKSAPKTQDNNG